jgi:8-oxo-dGTP diphosphatase
MAILHAWRHCPRCAGAVEARAGSVVCTSCGFVAYANSAPTASALVEDDRGRVLLARRAVEPYKGKWDIPGGFLEEGEHPLDGLRRELREEAGVEVEPGDLLGIWLDSYGDGPDAVATLNLYWTARITAGRPVPSDDVDQLRWFTADALPPPDEIAFANTGLVLEAWRARLA